MLLRKRGIFISQEIIRDIIGEPSYVKALADCLNTSDNSDDGKVWLGISTDEESLEMLLRGSDLAIVLLEEPVRNGDMLWWWRVETEINDQNSGPF